MIFTGRPDLSARSTACPEIIDGFFLSAEPTACLGLNHPDVRMCRSEQALQRLDHVERALHRAAVNRDAAFFRHGDDAIGLDVHVLLVSGPVSSFDDDVRSVQGAFDVTLDDAQILE